MNVFYLDKDPSEAAKFHCDKHVVKMILESAQILCTVINEKAGYQITPYKSTHRHHPCVIWAGESVQNATYVYSLAYYLNQQFMKRFKHVVNHKSYQMLVDVSMQNLIIKFLENKTTMSTPPLAMPEYCKMDDPVASYRLYYKLEKQDLLKYTYVNTPWWLL
jgi:hypothetical protein